MQMIATVIQTMEQDERRLADGLRNAEIRQVHDIMKRPSSEKNQPNDSLKENLGPQPETSPMDIDYSRFEPMEEYS